MATKKKARKAIKGRASKKVLKKPSKKTGKAPTRTRSRKKAKKLSRLEQLERYTKALEKRLRKYEGQRFAGPLKPGEKRRKPPKTELEAVRSKLKFFLESIKRQLEATDVAASYRSHENADYSIDAELRVPIDGNGMVDSVMIDVEEAGNWNMLNTFWVMMGLTVSADEVTGSPTIDKRPNRAWTNPVRGNRSGAAFFTMRETVFRKLEDYGGDVQMLVIRLTWHPDNLRPKRPRK